MGDSKDELQKSLGAVDFFTLSFGTMVGVGWITLLGPMLEMAGPIGVSIAFLLGGVLVLLIGGCYAEVASIYPVAGGEVAYGYEMFGTGAAFINGWLLALGLISVVSFEMISVGWIVTGLVPGIEGPVLYRIAGEDVTAGSLVIGLLFMVAITAFNARGAKAAATLQRVTTFGLIAITAVFILVCAVIGNPDNLVPMFAEQKGSTSAISAILAVFVLTPFWYSGFDAIPQAFGERKRTVSVATVAWTMVASIVAAMLFYGLIFLAPAMVAPRADIIAFDLPAASVFAAALGSPVAGKVILVAGLCGLVSTWNAIHFSAARVIFALGRAHLIPNRLGSVGKQFHAPRNAVLFVSVVGGLGGLFGKGVILPVVNTGALALSIVYAVVCFGLVKLRVSQHAPVADFRLPGGLTIPICAAVASSGVAIYSLQNAKVSTQSALPLEWVFIGAWAIIGIAFWQIARPLRSEISDADRRNLILTEKNAGP
ncbi:MAG: APC family permease [Pseudomonadota bacterium]